MRRFALPSAAGLVLLAAVAVPGAGARVDATSCLFTPPVILAEPAYTRGTTNTIRWERMPSNCWDNDDASGKKSTDRRFVVTVTNVQTGAVDTVTVHGDGEVDATIDPDEFPAGAIEGQRFSYTVHRKESACYSGSPVFGTCTDRQTRTGNKSPAVYSTQDGRAPTGSLVLGNGENFTRTLDVRAHVTANDPGSTASGPGFVTFAGAVAPCGLRSNTCAEPLDGDVTVRLATGADGPRVIEARVYDRARGPADDATATVAGFAKPPGNESGPIRASVIVDRTPPTVILSASTSRPTVGVPVTFNASNSNDTGGGSGVEASSAEWSFGDGNRRTGLVATYTYARTGTFPLVFTLSDRIGNVSRVAVGELTVVAAPVQAPPLTTSTTPTPAPTTVDRTPPAVSSLSAARRGRVTTVSFRLSERATVAVRVRRLKPAPVRVVGTLSRRLAAGRRGISLGAAVRKPGRYEVTIVARDAAGNASPPRTLRLTTRS